MAETFTVETDEEWVEVIGATTSMVLMIERGESSPLPGRTINAVYSPDMRSAAVSESTGEPSIMRTAILAVDSGEEIASASWESSPSLGPDILPLWLNNDDLLIHGQVVGGPLILNLRGDIVSVVPELFGGDCSGRVCYALASRSMVVSDYHLVVLDPTQDSGQTWLLYHARERVIEELLDLEWIWLSPDGERLAASVAKPTERGRLWARQMNPVGSPASVFRPDPPLETSVVPPAWAPDSASVAFAQGGGLGIARIYPDVGLSLWSIGDYSPTGVLWSGDSRHIAVTAYLMDSDGRPSEGLFLVMAE